MNADAPPCLEERYKIQMTNMLLSNKNFKNDHQFDNMSVAELRKNFFVLSLNFDSMAIDVIEEMQAFTIQDLFIYFGNNMGLFLGMSFMSPFEVLLLFVALFLATASCKNILSTKKFSCAKRTNGKQNQSYQTNLTIKIVTPNKNKKVNLCVDKSSNSVTELQELPGSIPDNVQTIPKDATNRLLHRSCVKVPRKGYVGVTNKVNVLHEETSTIPTYEVNLSLHPPTVALKKTKVHTITNQTSHSFAVRAEIQKDVKF